MLDDKSNNMLFKRTKYRHTKALNWSSNGKIPLIIDCNEGMPATYSMEEITYDPRAYLDVYLPLALNNLKIGSDCVPIIKLYFGAHILSSVFGGKLTFINKKIHVYEKGNISFLDTNKSPDIRMDFVEHVIAFYQYLLKYVPADIYVPIPHLTSPFGVSAILYGEQDFYLDMVVQPERIHRLLSEVTTQYINVTKKLYYDNNKDFSYTIHPMRGTYFEKGIWMADDAIVAISPEHIREFDSFYTQKISQTLNTKIYSHYCITESSQALHCLKSMAETEHIYGIANQYTPEFFVDNYTIFKNRLALISGYPLYNGLKHKSNSAAQAMKKFEEWAKYFIDSFQGKSGLIIRMTIPTVTEAQEIYGIWNELNNWDDED